MFNYKYLSQDDLNGFKKYKYSAIDTSPLSQYVMHPSWNAAVKIIPRWIAPNLITFVGFLCMVVAVLLLYVYDYEFYGAGGRPGAQSEEFGIPSWLYIASGILMFVAYNLDGIDGKQARRIGVSGPLGELFDHGLDSYVVFLMPYCVISIFGRDQEYSISCFRGYLMILSVVFNFYISHCEKYNTGTLYLPWGYDVSMWITSFIFIYAGIYGPGAFKIYMPGGLAMAQTFEVVAHSVGALTTYPVAVYNVYLSYKSQTGKMYPLKEAVRPLWSLVTVIIVMTYWCLKSPNDVIEYDPRAFIFLFGTLFSHIASRLIVAEMTHQPCDLICWMFWPLLSGVVASFIMPHREVSILYSLLLFCFVAHVHYGICVVRQICKHYRISCFSVPKEKLKR